MWSAFKYGILKVNSNLKFLIFLWIINLAFAAILTGPIFGLLKESLFHNIRGEELTLSFDFQWFMEFKYTYNEALQSLPNILIMVGIIYVLIQVFLMGGIFEVLNSEARKNHFIDYFYGCVRYFFRFFKVFLITLVCYGGLYYLNQIYIKYIQVITYSTESQFVIMAANIIRYLLIAAIFGVLNIIFDYVRIRIVVHQSYETLKDLWLTFKFLIKNFWTVSSLFWMVACSGLVIFLLYSLIDNFFNPTSYLTIILLIFIRQFYLIGKIWVKLLFCSCQLELYKEINSSAAEAVEVSEIEMPLKGA
jgi:hypothetical protein